MKEKIIEEEVYIREPERSLVIVCNTQREKYMQEISRARSKRENRLKKVEMENQEEGY